jgi:acylglycerol lipase
MHAVHSLYAARRIHSHFWKRHIALPVLILHGGADRLNPPEGSDRLYQTLGSIDKKLIVYPGLYHEILNESQHEKVVQHLLEWIQRHINPNP